jgi:hypothetical protein
MRIVSLILLAFLLICWPSDRTTSNLTVPPEEPGTFTAPHYMDQPQHEWPAWA